MREARKFFRYGTALTASWKRETDYDHMTFTDYSSGSCDNITNMLNDTTYQFVVHITSVKQVKMYNMVTGS